MSFVGVVLQLLCLALELSKIRFKRLSMLWQARFGVDRENVTALPNGQCHSSSRTGCDTTQDNAI